MDSAITGELRAPFPWFGGKRRVGPQIWQAFGSDVPNYVEPFAGSLAVLLARPGGPGKIETVNDLDGYLANFWRATAAAPGEVARWADAPVNELDLHARHRWLLEQHDVLVPKLLADPDHFDAKVAGWWVWGISAWIGHGWCKIRPGRPVGGKKRPNLHNIGKGVHQRGQKPRVERHGIHTEGDGDIRHWFERLRQRLRNVRVLCGDWSRVVTGAVTGASNTLGNMGMSPCGVFLDPPYAEDRRMAGIYAHDSSTVASDVRAWAIENGDNPKLRIALCGYEGEHDMPDTWRVLAWRAQGGYGSQREDKSNKNAELERVWLSPHCLAEAKQRTLFDDD